MESGTEEGDRVGHQGGLLRLAAGHGESPHVLRVEFWSHSSSFGQDESGESLGEWPSPDAHVGLMVSSDCMCKDTLN